MSCAPGGSGAGAAATPAGQAAATFAITADKPGNQVIASYDGSAAVFDVLSDSGIGSATVEQTSGERPRSVSIRLHLRAMEELRFTYGATTITLSVRSTRGTQLVPLAVVGGAEPFEVKPDSRYWMQAEVRAGPTVAERTVPLRSAYVDVTAPKDFLDGGYTSFSIRWIDLFR